MEQILSVTEVARNFSDIINRVYYQRQTFLLTRGGVVVAKLTSPVKALTGAELARRWPKEPLLTPEEAEAWEEEHTARQASVGPPSEDVWDL
jgi:antitoxin (DNA-binding transcriptional repressor) of toxin-antitoxin stability system